MIPTGPLRGTEFRPGGVPAPFTFGTTATQLSMVGGSGEDHGASFGALPALKRTTAFAHTTFDVTDNFTVFVEGLFGDATASYQGTAPWEGQTTGYSIQRDNAFLPASIVTRMTQANVTSFPLWRYDYDFGMLLVDSNNRTKRGTAASSGSSVTGTSAPTTSTARTISISPPRTIPSSTASTTRWMRWWVPVARSSAAPRSRSPTTVACRSTCSAKAHRRRQRWTG